MKAFKAKYRYGHFFDEKTSKRIIPNERAKVILVFDNEDDIISKDPIYTEEENIEAQEKLQKVKEYAAEKRYTYKRLLSAGEMLSFSISSAILKKQGEKENVKFTFSLQLQEDLYLIVRPKSSELFDAKCRLVSYYSDNSTIDFFEEISAKSLNQLYMRTYVFYFHRFGAGTVNVFSRFFYKGKPLSELRENALDSKPPVVLL
ncbi:hypothetical protein AB9P05_19260 [Roseivirga sp. BDSF3-8]|uniref:hypothetical protein n=1 Tax=Roseivirga sp. BDSF3-8 TaxID=3241598 RepID=UPI0035321C73